MDARKLAPERIPFVLEADLQGLEARRETTDVEGGSGIDLPNGRWEPHVGSATHPWRASDARLWCLRATDLSLV